MTVAPITDATFARELLENAISPSTTPTLTTAQVDALMDNVAVSDNDGTPQYTASDLNRAASLGWQWKAAVASAQFDAGVGTGKTFTLSQLYDHCMQQSALYGSGQLSVVGSVDVDDGTGKPGTYTSIGRIGLTSVMNTKGY